MTQYHDVKTQFDEGKEQLHGMEQQIEDLDKEKRELKVGWCHAIRVKDLCLH